MHAVSGASTLLRFERHLRVPALDVERRLVNLRRPGFRIYVIETRGLVVDSRVAPSLDPIRSMRRRPVGQATIPLRGGFVLRRGGRELVFTDRGAAVEEVDTWDERWDGPHFAAMVIEWDAEHGAVMGELDELALGAADRAFFADAASRIGRDQVDDRLVHAIVGRLRALGLPLAPTAEMSTAPPPPDAIVIAAAVGRLISNLDRAPDILELCDATGFEERHLRRRLQAVADWTSLSGSWREVLNQARLTMAASLATARGASLELMARTLGYRAPSAMLAAMRSGGLSSPARIRADVR